jgi:hypothetical protein
MNGGGWWWKFPEGFSSSPTVVSVAKEAGSNPQMVLTVYVHPNDHASQQPDRGSLAGFDAGWIVTLCKASTNQVWAIHAALTRRGVIVGNMQEVYGFTIGDRMSGDWPQRRTVTTVVRRRGPRRRSVTIRSSRGRCECDATG